MFNSILYFGRNNCFFSEKVKTFLKKNSKKFHYIESNFLGEKINTKTIYNLSFDYIFCFRSFYILEKNLIQKCRFAPVNFHPGPPEYRGVGAVNYAFYDNSKIYGCTAHIMNEKIDSGKILDVKRFSIKKTDDIESCLIKTYNLMVKQALYVINLLMSKDENLMKLIKKNKLEKWSKKIRKKKHLDKFYKINKNLPKKQLLRKIRATNTFNYKPYILLHGKKFFFIDEKKN